MFNIGTGKGLSVLEIIKAFEKSNNIKLNYFIGPRRDGDIDEIYSDNQKVVNELNWHLKYRLKKR